jgi:cell division protease FtsH
VKQNNSSRENKRRVQRLRQRVLIAAAVMVVAALAVYRVWNRTIVQEASLPALVSAIEKGEITSLAVQGDVLLATKSDGSSFQARKEANISAVEALQILGTSPEALKTLPILVKEPTNSMDNALGIMLGFIPLVIIGYVIFRVAGQNSGGLFDLRGGFGRSNPRVIAAGAKKDDKVERPLITFADVAGSAEAKVELQEIVEFLRDAEKFLKLGARIPKGVLMAGAPGTGKTLMAKAVAGEAAVPFFSISGSEFVEMFVGVGASRVRDLFRRAREQAPAVVFIDEIDAVGRQRGVGLGGGNDEREQTLNQILVEMDGFGTDANVIIMAATNRPDVLDPALLRPGRFDRKVVLDRPDVNARQAILEIHTRGMPLAADVKLDELAKLTPGFVGADLENLVNEAAILAGRRNFDRVGQREFQDAMERVIAGPERKTSILNGREREVVAYHEAGHAVVMHNLENSDPVHKVSIISRGMALGYTMPLPENDKYLRTKEAFEDEIVGLLGGRAAEEVIFAQITTGAANDLERATDLARAMVTRYGFSQKLGLRTFGEEHGNMFLGKMGETRNYSEETALTIDQEIGFILDGAYGRAKEIVSVHRNKLETLAKALLEAETIERPQFEMLMN